MPIPLMKGMQLEVSISTVLILNPTSLTDISHEPMATITDV